MIVTFDGDLLEISYIWKGDYYYCTESRTDRQRGLLRGVLFLQDVLRLDEYRFSIHLPIHPPCRHFSFIDHTWWFPSENKNSIACRSYSHVPACLSLQRFLILGCNIIGNPIQKAIFWTDRLFLVRSIFNLLSREGAYLFMSLRIIWVDEMLDS